MPNPSPNPFLNYFTMSRVFFSRASNDCLSPSVPCSTRRKRFAQKRFALHSGIKKLGTNFVVVQTNKLAMRVGISEFTFKNFRIPLAYSKGDERPDVAKNGALDLGANLINVLMRQC